VSKAFTKDDAEDEPAFVRPRAPLPDGVTNYVTTRGLALLRAELDAMGADRARLGAIEDDAERARDVTAIVARHVELEARIASAVVVDSSAQPHDEVRFGATVRVRAEDGAEKAYRIVGVDEADATRAIAHVAFVAPLARALLGKRVGDGAIVRTPHGDEELEVIAIDYGG
jgi:transcription elongation factor GreB